MLVCSLSVTSLKGPLTTPLEGKKRRRAKSLGVHDKLHFTVEQPCLWIYSIQELDAIHKRKRLQHRKETVC